MKDIWVIAENRRGKLLEVSLEAVSEMKRLAAQLGLEVSAFIMGENLEALIEQLAHYGADRVFLLESGMFEPYCSSVYARQLAELIRRHNPGLVVAGATSSSRDYFPRVAAMTGAGLVSDCRIFAAAADGQIHLSRPIYGGRAYEKIISQDPKTIMATINPGAFSKGKPDPSGKAEVVKLEVMPPLEALPIRVMDRIEADLETVDVSEAAMILAVGRGAGGKPGFERLVGLAGLIGFAVGGSRPAVDNQWIEYDRQIGQSGKTVAPEIYLACGISGDTWHVMGMKDSGFIIAINKDIQAPIFKICDVGVAADLEEIIPEMIRVLRGRQDQEGAGHD